MYAYNVGVTAIKTIKPMTHTDISTFLLEKGE